MSFRRVAELPETACKFVIEGLCMARPQGLEGVGQVSGFRVCGLGLRV